MLAAAKTVGTLPRVPSSRWEIADGGYNVERILRATRAAGTETSLTESRIIGTDRDPTAREGVSRCNRCATTRRFDDQQGGAAGVLGPSGSGKSTLLRLIAGLEAPSAGSVLFDGVNVTEVPPHRRDVAMVFQHPALYPHLSVFDNLAFGLQSRGISRNQVRARVNTVAGMLGLDHALTRRPAALSGGEKQRVAIGRALAANPVSSFLTSHFRVSTCPCGPVYATR